MKKKILLCLILSAMLFGLVYGRTLIQDVHRSWVNRNSASENTETEPTEPEYFAQDITFTGEYIESEDVMPYALYTPSSAADGAPVPVILFLHGRGEYGGGEHNFMNAGLPLVMNRWELEGFRAYVICPHMTGNWNTGYWSRPETANQIRDLLDKFIAEHAVNTEKIYLMGFSAGSVGALYMALELPEYFSKLVILSGLQLEDHDISQINMPVLGCAETSLSWSSFMRSEFTDVFGENSVRYYNVEHYLLPKAVFNDDADENRRSDLIEWLLQ